MDQLTIADKGIDRERKPSNASTTTRRHFQAIGSNPALWKPISPETLGFTQPEK